MRRHHPVLLRSCRAAVILSVSVGLSAALVAGPQTPSKVPTVAPAALQTLLPAQMDGWTKARENSDRIERADSCTYAFADVVYTSGESKVRITVADTGFDADALMALATIVVTFPADHTEVIPPDTTVARSTHNGAPSATLWNVSKREGEFVVVVAGRFVAKAEGTRIDGLDVLRSAIERLDLKKLAQLAQ